MQSCCRVLVWACRFTERPSVAQRSTQLSIALSAGVRVHQRSKACAQQRLNGLRSYSVAKPSAAATASPVPCSISSNSMADAPTSSVANEQPPGKKRKKAYDPNQRAMMSAVQERNAEAAWRSYGEGDKNRIVRPGILKAMVTLFLGMDDWASHLLPLPWHGPGAGAPIADVHIQWAEHLLNKIHQDGQASDDQYFTLKARLCALKNEPEEALHAAEECVATGTVRLRLYIPALVAFAAQGDPNGALRTFERVCAHGDQVNDLSETEYHYLLRVCCESGTYEGLSKVLKHMSTRLGSLSQPVLETLRTGFQDRPELANNGQTPWEVLSVHVDPQGDGFIEAIQDRLLEVSLESAEWEQFAQSVLELANSRERKAGSFAKFVTAVEDNDHTIFLDAANIAFFNTMKFMTDNEKQCDERFQWPQVNQVYQLVRETFPASRVMVIAHNYRCRAQFVRTKESRQFLDELQKEGNLWVTPNGSNDDWYWLYGTISKGRDGMLISNDDMRDHIFELLRPRYFSKWRQHHRCKYNVCTDEASVEASLDLPPKFSTCVQFLPQSGAWMFPGSDGMWLCVRPCVSKA